MKINWFNSEEYFSLVNQWKGQITDSISENLTKSDLESMYLEYLLIFLQYLESIYVSRMLDNT